MIVLSAALALLKAFRSQSPLLVHLESSCQTDDFVCIMLTLAHSIGAVPERLSSVSVAMCGRENVPAAFRYPRLARYRIKEHTRELHVSATELCDQRPQDDSVRDPESEQIGFWDFSQEKEFT
jgi:hypothetical protein